jgi:hypothetical protein
VEIVPVPAVSKVTLLAPDPVSGPAAVPPRTAVPAVQVTPIPADEVRREDGGAENSDDAAGTDRTPTGAGSHGATAIPRTPEGTAGGADPQAKDAAGKADPGTAERATGEADPETSAGGTGEAEGAPPPTAAGDGAAPGDGATPGEDTPPAEDTSTQSISVVAGPTVEDLSTTALPVVDSKTR